MQLLLLVTGAYAARSFSRDVRVCSRGMSALLTALSSLPGFERELRLLPHLVRRGSVAVDVGASLGAYAIPMALLAGAVRNGLDDGLSETPPLPVRVQTMDEVRAEMGRPIDFVKCDVEGFELDVFQGSRRVLAQDRPVVLCELEERHATRYGRTVADVVGLFHELDYVVSRSTSDARNVLFVPDECVSTLTFR